MGNQEKKAYLSRYPVLDKEIERKSRELALWQQKSFQTGSEQMKRLEMDMAEDIMRLASLKKRWRG